MLQWILNLLRSSKTEIPDEPAAISTYYNDEQVQKVVDQGGHRAVIGGMWDEIGKLQFDFMAEQGLQPRHRFLDLGCGSLRGGVHFISYLDPGNYYGLDMNQSLLNAGYEIELKKAGLQVRQPRENLLCEDQFRASRFDVRFDRVIALSVFTHLPVDLIRLALQNLAPAMKKNGVFYATVFLKPDDYSGGGLLHEPGGITTHDDRDPYHYALSDLKALARELSWDLKLIERFNHPRDQKMLELRYKANDEDS